MSDRLDPTYAQIIGGRLVGGPPLGRPGQTVVALQQDGTYALFIEQPGQGFVYAGSGSEAAVLASANAHADAGDVTTLASANSHADAGDAAEASARATAVTNAIATAEAYTDAALVSDRTGRDAGAARSGETGVTDTRYAVGDVRRYGAKVDGSTVDDAAWAAAIAFAQTNKHEVIVPAGSHVLATTITDSAGAVAFRMAGPENTIIRWAGAAGSWVFSFTQQRSRIRVGCKILGHTSDWSYNGVRCSGSASRGRFEEVYCYRPDTGVQLDGVYGNLFHGLNVYQAKTRGIDLVNLANSNILVCKEISGNSVAGSRGISINGEANVLTGNQLSGFASNLYQEAGWANRIDGFYNENALTYNLYLAAGSLEYQTVGMTHRRYVAPGAILLTSAGRGVAPGVGYQPAKRLPTKGLTAFYPMHEGSGTVLRDYSGNRNHASLTGGATWVSGPYGSAVRCDATGNVIVPAAAVTYNQPWTVALLVNAESYASSGNRVFSLSDGTNTIQLFPVADSTVLSVRRNGVFVQNLVIPSQSAGDDVWVIVSYNGTDTLTLRNPSMVGWTSTGLSCPLSNPFAGPITSVLLNASTANTVVTYSSIAIWNRELTADEAFDWVNRPANVVPIQAAPFVISQSITPVSVAAQTVARQTFTVSGLVTTDHVTVDPPSSSGNVGLTAARVSATNQLELTFINPTAGALTPTAGTFLIKVTRA